MREAEEDDTGPQSGYLWKTRTHEVLWPGRKSTNVGGGSRMCPGRQGCAALTETGRDSRGGRGHGVEEEVSCRHLPDS